MMTNIGEPVGELCEPPEVRAQGWVQQPDGKWEKIESPKPVVPRISATKRELAFYLRGLAVGMEEAHQAADFHDGQVRDMLREQVKRRHEMLEAEAHACGVPDVPLSVCSVKALGSRATHVPEQENPQGAPEPTEHAALRIPPQSDMSKRPANTTIPTVITPEVYLSCCRSDVNDFIHETPLALMLGKHVVILPVSFNDAWKDLRIVMGIDPQTELLRAAQRDIEGWPIAKALIALASAFATKSEQAAPSLLDEVVRLKEGRFTPEELQNLCHNLSADPRNYQAFCDGCDAEQRKLFGVCRTDDLNRKEREGVRIELESTALYAKCVGCGHRIEATYYKPCPKCGATEVHHYVGRSFQCKKCPETWFDSEEAEQRAKLRVVEQEELFANYGRNVSEDEKLSSVQFSQGVVPIALSRKRNKFVGYVRHTPIVPGTLSLHVPLKAKARKTSPKLTPGMMVDDRHGKFVGDVMGKPKVDYATGRIEFDHFYDPETEENFVLVSYEYPRDQ